MPRTLLYLGLTGKIVPPNEVLIRFQRMVRATLPARSVAPMTATTTWVFRFPSASRKNFMVGRFLCCHIRPG